MSPPFLRGGLNPGVASATPEAVASLARGGPFGDEPSRLRDLTLNASTVDNDDQWTRQEFRRPTLLHPARDNSVLPAEELGYLRPTAHLGTRDIGNKTLQFRPAFTNGHLWLPTPGLWWLRNKGVQVTSETGVVSGAFRVPYVAQENPSPEEVQQAMFGRGYVVPVLAAKTVSTTWTTAFTFRDRWSGSIGLNLQVRGDDCRIRWAGTTAGTGFHRIDDGESRFFTGANFPLGSLWIRAANSTATMVATNHRTG